MRDYPTVDEIRVTGWQPGGRTVTGFTKESAEKFEGALSSGNYWARVVDGKLHTVPVYHSLPDPVTDKDMAPFWRQVRVEPNLFGAPVYEVEKFAPTPEHSSAHISIQHLCGYAYTPERYKIEGEKLESWGFECMRSRRSPNGQFWEVWFLPGLFLAKGALEEAIGKEKADQAALDRAVEFLRSNSIFGTLDVSVQRLAMCAPD